MGINEWIDGGIARDQHDGNDVCRVSEVVL